MTSLDSVTVKGMNRLVLRHFPLGQTSRASSRYGHRLMTTAGSSPAIGPVEISIRRKLTSLLEPIDLTVINDSWKHQHHAAMREQGGGNGETHFSVTVVSTAFKGKNLMQRHRMIYGALADELQQGLHALSLVTKTPDEFPTSSS